MMASKTNRALLYLGFLLCMAAMASAMDHVTFRRDGREIQQSGRLLVEAQDGGLLLLSRDGVLWAITPDEQIKHTSDDAPFEPFNREEMTKHLLVILPKNFEVYQTTHYLIFFDTSRAYAQWCGSLFERLYMTFRNYWIHKGFELAEPEFPLVAVIFADKQAYLKFSRAELGEAGDLISGYFNLMTNRMTMYDLTGVETAGRPAGRLSTFAQINQILAQPDALQAVSTIVHEATHQIAFNCGLHTRLSDCPLWLSEGIAVYFETPDLHSAKGWSGIGAVNQPRWQQFLNYLNRRPADSLQTLIATDKRFRETKQSLDAYGESWALTYFLINKRPKEYIAYLRMLSKKKPLSPDPPERRLQEFQRFFGDIKQLDVEFLRYMSKVR
jgi:hypothetical protein